MRCFVPPADVRRAKMETAAQTALTHALLQQGIPVDYRRWIRMPEGATSVPESALAVPSHRI
jgi:hypothetical protein